MIDIRLPLTEEKALGLRSGDRVLLSGHVYTARDAAHRRMYACLEKGEPLPVDVTDQTIYYVGPTPAFGDHIIGSAGPTTALRMDRFTPALYKAGLRATIGKGDRSEEVRRAIAEHKGVYFAALGGIGALLSKCIKQSAVVAYADLGTEAIHRFMLERFPAIVIYDAYGGDYYMQARNAAQHRNEENREGMR